MDKTERMDQVLFLLAQLPRAIRKSTERDLIKPLLHSVDPRLAPHHLPIMKIVQEEGTLSMSRIAGSAMISRAQMTQSVERLIELGLLERRPDQTDRRRIDVALTEKGRKTVEVLDAAVKQHLTETLSWLSDEDIDRLLDCLRFVLGIIEKF